MANVNLAIAITAVDHATAQLATIRAQMAMMGAQGQSSAAGFDRFGGAVESAGLRTEGMRESLIRLGGAAGVSESMLGGLSTAVLAFAPVALALTGVAMGFEAIKGATETTVEFGLATEKLRTEIGGTTQQASELLAVFQRYDITAEQAGTRMAMFSRQLAGVHDALEQTDPKAKGFTQQMQEAGIQVRNTDGTVRNMLPVLLEMADRFKAMPDGIQKTALVTAAFGRGSEDMTRVLNLGSADLQKAMKTAADYGLALDDTTLPAILKLEESQKDAGEAAKGLQVAIGTLATPILTQLEFGATRVITNLMAMQAQVDSDNSWTEWRARFDAANPNGLPIPVLPSAPQAPSADFTATGDPIAPMDQLQAAMTASTAGTDAMTGAQDQVRASLEQWMHAQDTLANGMPNLTAQIQAQAYSALPGLVTGYEGGANSTNDFARAQEAAIGPSSAGIDAVEELTQKNRLYQQQMIVGTAALKAFSEQQSISADFSRTQSLALSGALAQSNATGAAATGAGDDAAAQAAARYSVQLQAQIDYKARLAAADDEMNAQVVQFDQQEIALADAKLHQDQAGIDAAKANLDAISAANVATQAYRATITDNTTALVAQFDAEQAAAAAKKAQQASDLAFSQAQSAQQTELSAAQIRQQVQAFAATQQQIGLQGQMRALQLQMGRDQALGNTDAVAKEQQQLAQEQNHLSYLQARQASEAQLFGLTVDRANSEIELQKAIRDGSAAEVAAIREKIKAQDEFIGKVRDAGSSIKEEQAQAVAAANVGPYTPPTVTIGGKSVQLSGVGAGMSGRGGLDSGTRVDDFGNLYRLQGGRWTFQGRSDGYGGVVPGTGPGASPLSVPPSAQPALAPVVPPPVPTVTQPGAPHVSGPVTINVTVDGGNAQDVVKAIMGAFQSAAVTVTAGK